MGIKIMKWLVVFVIGVLISVTQTSFCADIIVDSYTKAGLPPAGTAGRIARVTDDVRGLWMDQGSQWFGINGEIVNIKEFGAKGDGVTDDTAAIQAAINAAPYGSSVFIPTGKFKFSSLTVSKPITIFGTGWHTSENSPFGSVGWSDLNNHSGSILVSTATTGNAMTFDANFYFPYRIRDVMVVGPGSGTSVGISIGGTGPASIMSFLSNVLVVNFSTGYLITNVQDSTFFAIRGRGNLTGISINLNSNQNVFHNTEIQSFTTGLRITNAARNDFYGGLFQNGGTAVSLIGNMDSAYFSSLWFESLSSYLFTLDTTTPSVKAVRIESCRSGSTVPVLNVIGSNTINNLIMTGNLFDGAPITIPNNVINCLISESMFSSFTDNGQGTIVLGSNYGGVPAPSFGAATTFKNQIISSLTTGTAPFSITSTTPVTNLTAVPATYNAAGNQQVNAHIVGDAVTLASGIATVNLSGAAAFSAASSYSVTLKEVKAGTSTQQFTVEYVSGSQFKIRSSSGTSTAPVRFIAVGN